MTNESCIVVVGAGQAGAMAAARLRNLGFAGRLLMLGDEPLPPYERPPLSKAVLQGDETATQARLFPSDFYQEQRIELMLGTAVTAIDRERRELRLADGRAIGYDACLIATGGKARELSALPRGTPRVHYLRDMTDALALRQALAPGQRLAVIGGGYLGLEAASTALAMGAEATVLESAPALLTRSMPSFVASWLAERARHAGVTLRLDSQITAIEPATDGGHRILLQEGLTLQVDHIVVAIGLEPDVRLAREAGLDIHPGNNGIAVDAECRTSDPAIFAAGDCTSQARAPGLPSVRMESWQNANEQAHAAAAAMLGEAPPKPALPWFWTDQFGCNIQMQGDMQPDLDYALRGIADVDADTPKCLWLGMRDGVPVHGIAINAGGELRQLRPLFEQGIALDPATFADPSVPLKTLVKAAREAATVAAG